MSTETAEHGDDATPVDPRATLRRSAPRSPRKPGGSPASPAGEPEKPLSLPGYELIEELARGSTGVVFRARQANLDRDVAVKTTLIHDAADAGPRLRFLSEAVVTGSLDHPNVVPTHDLLFDEEGRPSLSMKLIGGVTWEELLHPKTDAQQRRAAELDLDRHLEILLAVCNAVAFAHSRGILHRDLKPANVMIGDYGEVLVMDWGLAVSVADENPARDEGGRSIPWRAPRPTTVSDPEGTPAYMAPEMANGRGDLLRPASDVYLLGAILYEIATGAPPHLADSVAEALRLAAAGKYPSLPAHVPRELRAICERALAPEPGDRYRDAAEFQRALRHFTTHRQSLAIAEAAAERLEQARERAASDPGASRAALYTELAEAASGFRQALLLWPGNPAALAGKDEARLAHAHLALESGDLGLAESLVAEIASAEARELSAAITSAQRRRDRALRRSATLRRSLLAIAVVALALLLSTLFLFDAMRESGDEIADQMGTLLTDDALLAMKRAVEAGARDIRRIRTQSEVALFSYARAVEEQLLRATPPALEHEPLRSSAIEGRPRGDAAEPSPSSTSPAREGKQAPSTAPPVRQSFFAPPGADAARIREQIARLEATHPALRWLFGERNPAIARFFVALADSRLYAQYPGTATLPAGYDPTQRDWFQLGRKTSGMATTPAYRDAATGQWVVSIVTPLRAGDRTLGVAGVDFDVATLLASRRPTESWAEEVLVSVLRVAESPGPASDIAAVLGEIPSSGGRARVPAEGVALAHGDPDLGRTIARALRTRESEVVRTEDTRGDWLWALAQVGTGNRRSERSPVLLLAMAAPTAAVVEFAEQTRARIRTETRAQIRRAMTHAGVGLAIVLATIALLSLLGRSRSGSP